MPNVLIKDGMVVWKGKDPRRGYCYYTYSEGRNWNGKKSICFPDMVDDMERLGFTILPHWSNHGNVMGWYAVQGLQYHGPYESVDTVEISPIVEKIFSGDVTNSAFKNLLSLEKE